MIRKGVDLAVARWAAGKLGTVFLQPYTAWGIADRNGRLRGAVIFNDHADSNVELSIYAPHCLTPGVCREIAAYCFDALKCERVTVRTRASNDDVLNAIVKAGWRAEGTLRRWYGADDAIIFGMTREECRFLR